MTNERMTTRDLVKALQRENIRDLLKRSALRDRKKREELDRAVASRDKFITAISRLGSKKREYSNGMHRESRGCLA